jgi:hypothetical protein
MKQMNKQASAIALTANQIQTNEFAAFSASSMMVLVKKDLFGLGDEQTSSPAAPPAW